ncbi:MAG: hypothetical protein EA357_03740 [Micavibrio sp.]|nr:MAG: hypothetical protein EA357_03740 [Micavibrio sp.]
MGKVTDLQTERRKQLETLLQELSARTEIGDGAFAEAVYAAVSSGFVTEEQFRREFGLSSGAVERWTTGKNLPQPEVRAVILRWAVSEIQNNGT